MRARVDRKGPRVTKGVRGAKGKSVYLLAKLEREKQKMKGR